MDALFDRRLAERALAQNMLDYIEQADKLHELGAHIETLVMRLGKTYEIGGLKVRYSAPSKTVNYQAAVEAERDKSDTEEDRLFIADLVSDNSTTTTLTATAWKKVAEALELDLEPFSTPKPARVTLDYKPFENDGEEA